MQLSEATHRSVFSTLSHFNINKTALAHYVNTVSLWSKTERKKQREKKSCDNVCARRARVKRFTITKTSFGVANWRNKTHNTTFDEEKAVA